MKIENKTNPTDKSDEIWQQLLNTNLNSLLKCQESLNLSSCFECERLLECDIRDKYVSSVYTSMNKGQEGGFEF